MQLRNEGISSAPASGVRCELFSHSAGQGVRTSTATAAPNARFKSRTAAVSITMSPGDCPLRRISLLIVRVQNAGLSATPEIGRAHV